MQRPWNLSPRRLKTPPLCLTFAPRAWLKLQFFCHAGPTEVGGFGITAEDHLLYVEDFVTVRQQGRCPVGLRLILFLDPAMASARLVNREGGSA